MKTNTTKALLALLLTATLLDSQGFAGPGPHSTQQTPLVASTKNTAAPERADVKHLTVYPKGSLGSEGFVFTAGEGRVALDW